MKQIKLQMGTSYTTVLQFLAKREKYVRGFIFWGKCTSLQYVNLLYYFYYVIVFLRRKIVFAPLNKYMEAIYDFCRQPAWVAWDDQPIRRQLLRWT